MALDVDTGRRMLQLLTSRFDDRHWRKKIEKTLSLPATGVGDDRQRAIFLYLKHGLKAYKSRSADPDSWIVGGYATKEVLDRVKFDPQVVDSEISQEQVAMLGVDPGPEVDEVWWEDMLVGWFEEPEPEPTSQDGEQSVSDERSEKADA